MDLCALPQVDLVVVFNQDTHHIEDCYYIRQLCRHAQLQNVKTLIVRHIIL